MSKMLTLFGKPNFLPSVQYIHDFALQLPRTSRKRQIQLTSKAPQTHQRRRSSSTSAFATRPLALQISLSKGYVGITWHCATLTSVCQFPRRKYTGAHSLHIGQLQLCLDVAREVIRASPSCPSDADNSQTTKAIYRAAKALNSLNDYSEALSMLESITGPQHHGYVPELKERILFMQRLHPKPIPGPGETLFLYRSKCCSNVWKHTYDFQIALNPNTIGSHSFLVLVRSFVAIVDPLLESDLSILCAMCKKRRASAHLHAPMLYLSRKWIVDWTIGTCSAACDLEAEKKMVEMGATVI